MEKKKVFGAKHWLIFNVALSCLIVGFAIGIFTFACSTGKTPAGVAYAQDAGNTANSGLMNLQNSFRQAAEKIMPAVVKIDVVDKVTETVPSTNRNPFNFFLNPFQRGNQDNEQGNQAEPQTQEYDRPGLGSGVIVKKEGNKVYVLTNNHVVGEADEIHVTLHDQRNFPAKITGTDVRKDLALIVFETNEQVAVAELGNSDDLFVGDWALAVGNPYGLESTVTAGIISALGRQGGPSDKNINDFIQTDAVINPGNSGGALVNIYGQVIGINTWIASDTGAYTGYGFAIPINNAKKAITDFISLGKVEYGWLGVSIADPSDAFLDAMKVKGTTGAFVFNVFRGSPADKGGIIPGDYIVKLNSTKIKDTLHLTNMIGDLPVDKTYDFIIIRAGKEITKKIKIEVRKSEDEITKSNKNLWPGFSIAPLTDALRKQLKIDDSLKGILISAVDTGTPAQIAGLTEGDIITKVNQKTVNNPLDFYTAFTESNGGEIMLKLSRNGVELIIGLVR